MIMKFFHRTTEENWAKIQEEKILWGKSSSRTYRYTYLALKDWGDSYGNVLLEVEFEPKKEDFGKIHNYGFDPPPGQICVQFSVFVPIPLDKVKRIMTITASA